jgi:hypothetical protein
VVLHTSTTTPNSILNTCTILGEMSARRGGGGREGKKGGGGGGAREGGERREGGRKEGRERNMANLLDRRYLLFIYLLIN